MTDTGYTKRAARVLTLTEQAAGGGEQTTEHLLIALIREAEGVAGQVLTAAGLSVDRVRITAEEVRPGCGESSAGRFDSVGLASVGIDLAQVRAEVERTLGPGALDRAATQQPTLSGSLRRALLAARGHRSRLHHPWVGTEHLLLGALSQPDSLAVSVLTQLGLHSAQLTTATERRLQQLTGSR